MKIFLSLFAFAVTVATPSLQYAMAADSERMDKDDFTLYSPAHLPQSFASGMHGSDMASETERLSKKAKQCFESTQHNYSEVLHCYRDAQADLPLNFTRVGMDSAEGVEKRRFELVSQFWPSDHAAKPGKWLHDVDMYIPDHAIPGRALLIVNNGVNFGTENYPPKGPSDFSDASIRSIANQTKTIVVAVSNIPNQYLKFEHVSTPMKEDDIVAHSWKLFLDSPIENAFASVHIPMMGSVIKAMDLAERELKHWKIRHFIAAGSSKRGWTTWHAAIADSRIEAIVPFVFDGLNINEMLDHTYRVYGKSWPIALKSYLKEGVMEQRHTANFEKLMKIEDPLNYVDTQYASRLSIPKYIVNASGDDFFTPDNARLYLDRLPGMKALRVIPNSNHYGIREYAEKSLVTFIKRLQATESLPGVASKVVKEDGSAVLMVSFSEKPVQVTKWIANNPAGRDFRYACGIRFAATVLSSESKKTINIPMEEPSSGWTAIFVEAHFADGFIATTPVYISPDEMFPDIGPSDKEGACKTIYDRERTNE